MKYAIVKLGRVKLVIIITLIAVLCAISLNTLFYELLNNKLISESTYSARVAIIPLFITPLLSWFIVGVIFELNNLEKKMSRLATYDDLTKLLNRRAFYDSCKILHKHSMQNKQEYAVISVDLDLFKQINDTYGHSVGDEVLKNFGQISKTVSRKNDIIGRVGGEEFIFFLPNTNLNQASQFAERLSDAVQETSINIDNSQINYTISQGVTMNAFLNKVSLEEVFKVSDQALYSAKENGRNQIAIYIAVNDKV